MVKLEFIMYKMKNYPTQFIVQSQKLHLVILDGENQMELVKIKQEMSSLPLMLKEISNIGLYLNDKKIKII
jgi:hypothetical protein